MSGVTILNEIIEPIIEHDKILVISISAIVGMILIVVAAFICAKITDNADIPEEPLVFIAIFLILVIVFSTAYFIDNKTQKYIGDETKYEVLIDNTVSMQEFYEKYKIVDQRGQIYVVKEKPTENLKND